VAQVQQRILSILGLALVLDMRASAQKFYPDDPIWSEPNPLAATDLKARKLSDYYDFFWHTFATPGERQRKREPIRAQGVNTLGEVPDGAWYTNRHGRNRMTLEALRRGPYTDNAPSMNGPWMVVGAKTEGVTPGLTIQDSRGVRYILKVDPKSNPEMATAADVIGAKFFYALGYYVPENYVVHFDRRHLVVKPGASLSDASGKKRKMKERDIDEILYDVPRDSADRYRAVASLYVAGAWLGPFRYHGVRKDDPNDITPHEHLRELRGLFVYSAWLGHHDVKSLNTVDFLVEEDGIPFVRHYLIDFGAALGSDSIAAKSPRSGNEYLFQAKPSIVQALTLGLYVPEWAKAHFPDLPAAGHFESTVFQPEQWKPNYPNPAFQNRLPDDTFWAAKQVMAFRDQEIRALVETGEYSDPRTVDWLTRCLIERRDKIGRRYFADVLPLDQFQVSDGRLVFEDLAVKYGIVASRQYQVQWSRFDNDTGRKSRLTGGATPDLPMELRNAQPGEYFAAEIRSDEPSKTVTAYLRKETGRIEVVGIDRTW
jgi:hypothetical protein